MAERVDLLTLDQLNEDEINNHSYDNGIDRRNKELEYHTESSTAGPRDKSQPVDTLKKVSSLPSCPYPGSNSLR